MKLIFVTGGVVSSLGKGIVTASLASLLRSRGVKLKIRKLDPYLNVHPYTMIPYQHREVYFTDDSYETDLDLRHYERFTDITCSKNDSISSGKIYYALESPYLFSTFNSPIPSRKSSRISIYFSNDPIELRKVGLMPISIICSSICF